MEKISGSATGKSFRHLLCKHNMQRTLWQSSSDTNSTYAVISTDHGSFGRTKKFWEANGNREAGEACITDENCSKNLWCSLDTCLCAFLYSEGHFNLLGFGTIRIDMWLDPYHFLAEFQSHSAYKQLIRYYMGNNTRESLQIVVMDNVKMIQGVKSRQIRKMKISVDKDLLFVRVNRPNAAQTVQNLSMLEDTEQGLNKRKKIIAEAFGGFLVEEETLDKMYKYKREIGLIDMVAQIAKFDSAGAKGSKKHIFESEKQLIRCSDNRDCMNRKSCNLLAGDCRYQKETGVFHASKNPPGFVAVLPRCFHKQLPLSLSLLKQN